MSCRDPCFTAASRTDDRQGFAFVHLEINTGQFILGRMGIAERHIPKFNRSGFFPILDAAFTNRGSAIQHLIDTLRGNLRLRQQHEDHRQHHKGHYNVGRILAL